MESTDIADGFEDAQGDFTSQKNGEAGNTTQEFSDEDNIPALIENLTLVSNVSIEEGKEGNSGSQMKEDIDDQAVENGVKRDFQSMEQNLTLCEDNENTNTVVQDNSPSESDTSNSASPYVNQILICPICSEYLKNPKLLPCLHSFCCCCLEKLLLIKREKQKQKLEKETETKVSIKVEAEQSAMDTDLNALVEADNDIDETKGSGQDCSNKTLSNLDEISILCPVCNQNFELLEEGVHGLTTNYVLINMIKTAEKLTQKARCEICKLRDILEEAVGYCIDCKDMLCQSCWQSHSFTRFTLTHKIVPLEEMKSHITIENEPIAKCESHHEEALKYFCSDCNCLLCRECLLLSHQGHSCDLSSKKAESRRQDLKALIYGFNERLASIKNDEKLEYETQMERILDAENVEVQKINDFCNRLVNTIENKRQKEVVIAKNLFQMVKTQCTSRYASFQKIQKNMQDVVPLVQLFETQACDNDMLTIEPTIHHRLVELTNMDMKPYPVSWYSLPIISSLNPIQVKCQKDEIEFLLFKRTGAKQKFEPADSVPVKETLKEMVAAGKFKEICYTSCLEKDDEVCSKPPQNMSSGAGFIDATLWPQASANQGNKSVRQSSNGMKILNSSNSEWSDTDTTEDPSTDKNSAVKKKRGKRGGKKKKIKREVVDTQNLFQRPSLQNKAMKTPTSNSLMGSYFPTVQDTFGRMPETSFGMPGYDYNNMYQEHFQPYTASGPFYEPMSWMPGDMYSQNGVPYPFERQIPTSVAYSTPAKQGQKLVSAPQKKNQQQAKEKPKNVNEKSQQQTKEKPKNVTGGGSQAANASVKTNTDAPTRMISLQPKWRLDVKLSSDVYEPQLQGVYCLQGTCIIVSDVHNSKVKTFSIKGEFLKSLDIKNVGRAIFTSDVLVYNLKNRVCGQKEDGGEINPMIFDNTDNCYISWFPKGHILVANKNKIRQYSVDKEKGHFVKKKNIGLEGAPVKEIADVRSNMQGQKIVVVDSSSKSVVIFDIEGNTLGSYSEEGNSQWKPTSASFDKKSNVFVTDSGGNRLVFLNQSGQFIQQWDTSPTINKPMFVTTNQLQPLYITGHGRYVHVYDYTYL